MKTASAKKRRLTPYLRDIKKKQIGGLIAGNRGELITEGDLCFKKFCEEISRAEQTINLETYIFRSDDAGWEIAHRLADAADRGVEVNVIFDAIGCLKTSRSIFSFLKKHSVSLIKYNPIEPWRRFFNITFRDHRKILVIDSKVAYIGGLNIGNEYAGNMFTMNFQRDTHIRIEGPIVNDIQFFFIENWFRCGGRVIEQHKYFRLNPKKRGNMMMMVLSSRAHHLVRPIRVSYLSAIDNARDSIFIENAYFIPDHRILKSLSQAARRGVDVRIMLTHRYVMPFVQHAVRFLYKKYLQNGIKVYEYKRSVLHAKTAVIDGLWSTVGSSNIDRLSFWYNLEINSVVLDEKFGEKMQKVFFDDLEFCEEIDLESLKKRSLLTFLKQWICYRFRNIL